MKIQFQRLLKIDYNSLNKLNQFTFTNFLGERRMKTSITKIMLATSLMAFGVATSHAGDKFELSGEIRTRAEMSAKDFNSDTDSENFGLLRTRLNAKFMPLNHLDVVLTLQDSRVEGSEASTTANSRNLDLHQGYFNWKTINGSNFGLKVGRMEMSYANQRLIGSVGWSNVGRSFDGGVITYNGENFKADLFNAKVVETNPTGLSDNNGANRDFGDTELVGLHTNFMPSESMTIQPFFYFRKMKIDDGSTAAKDESSYDYLATLGAYYKLKTESGNGIELDAAYQFGKNDVTDVETKAYMFGVKGFMWFGDDERKYGINAGLDMLSGNDGSDPLENTTFNTLYATNHKFYGHMDYFLANPAGGLQDIFVGLKYKKTGVYGANLDVHLLKSVEDVAIAGNTETDYGTEFDLSLWWKVNPNMKLYGGFSAFAPGKIYDGDTAYWSYSGFKVWF